MSAPSGLTMAASLEQIPDDALSLLVSHIIESKRPARTILRTLCTLTRTCKSMYSLVAGRLNELRGLPTDVWETTARSIPAQITWIIKDFHKVKEEKERVFSPQFRNGPHTWRLLVFPNGDEVERHRPDAKPHMSLYVDVADAAMLPYGWVREAHFVLTVPNKKKPSKTIVRYARHDFEATARDWGFRELVPLADLEDRDGGLLSGGHLTLRCSVWGITDAQRVWERAQKKQAQRRFRRNRFGGGSSGVGSTSASSTSVGSEDLAMARCGVIRARSNPAHRTSSPPQSLWIPIPAPRLTRSDDDLLHARLSQAGPHRGRTCSCRPSRSCP